MVSRLSASLRERQRENTDVRVIGLASDGEAEFATHGEHGAVLGQDLAFDRS